MAITLEGFYRALRTQARELSQFDWAEHHESLPQQLLHQAAVDVSLRGLAPIAVHRLHQVLGAEGGLGLATRWSTSHARNRLRPEAGKISVLRVAPSGRTVLFAGGDEHL